MLPVIGAIALGVGAVAGAASSIMQGDEAKRAAEANARMARLAAEDARRRGATQAGQARMQGSQVVAQQRAVFGVSGVDSGTGTAARLAAVTQAAAEVDAQTLRNNATRQAYGLEQQSSEMQRQGSAAQTAGYWGAAGSLLGGAGQIAGIGYKQGWFGGSNG